MRLKQLDAGKLYPMSVSLQSVGTHVEHANEKIVVFSKYFGYEVGGAEKSVLELLKARASSGTSIEVVRIANIRTYGAASRPMHFPADWSVRDFKLRTDLERWRYVEYAANRSAIVRFFSSLEPSATLYAYGMLAPAAILGFRGRTVYLVRDEYGLGWDRNYFNGFARLVREVYTAAQAPMRALWLNDLHAAITRSKLIANSRFIHNELAKLSPDADIDIIPSHVDCDRLRASTEAVRLSTPDANRRCVVAIGASRIKGGDIVYRVAKAMPDRSFLLFDKAFRIERHVGNLTEMPWAADAATVYARAAVVMVPSRWEEAFPRAVLEARCLGIPVVASRKGGIPEAVGEADILIDDMEDVESWCRALSMSL